MGCRDAPIRFNRLVTSFVDRSSLSTVDLELVGRKMYCKELLAALHSFLDIDADRRKRL